MVYNGGLMPTKGLESVVKGLGSMMWMNYHLIDSNFDGKIDIFVYNDIDLNQDNFVDERITAWVYDADFDGMPDKGEYLGEAFQKPLESEEGVLTVRRAYGRRVKIKTGDRAFQLFDKILLDINSLF